MTAEEQIQALNQKCVECQMAFDKEGIQFSPSMCQYCHIGTQLHYLMVHTITGEKKWDAIDWNSSRFKTFYQG